MDCTYNKKIFGTMFPDVEIPFDKVLFITTKESVQTFINEAFDPTKVPGKDFKAIIKENGSYQIRSDGDGIVNYLRNPSTNPYKLNEKLLKSNVITRLVVPQGIPQTPDGRINLGSVGGNPCEAGFYGHIGEIWEIQTPVYKVCYFDRSQRIRGIAPNGIVGVDDVFVIESLDNKNSFFEEIRNETQTPQIISNEISIESGRGVSIIQDLVACPPTFNATDYDFGEVESREDGVLSITNESTIPLLINNITPKKNPNFSIGNFLDVDLGNPFEKYSPLQTPFELKGGQTREFEIFYSGFGEFDINHEMIIEYDVRTLDGTSILGKKLTSTVRGKTYNLRVRCNDIDWGKINIKNTPLENTLKINIENIGSRDIYLVGYRLRGKNPDNFVNITIPNVSKTFPYLISKGKTESFDISYDPMGQYDIRHNAEVYFDFVYIDPTTNQFAKEIYSEKIISYLSAEPFKEEIDTIIDEYGGGILITDDNGTYILKTISRIINKSIPIQKWNTKGMWKCSGEKLDTFFTSSISSSNNQYYLSVYQEQMNNPESYHQFDISFGHKNGLGSRYILNGADLKPSQVMYKKYLVECYPPSSSSAGRLVEKFKFKNGINGDYVYFIQTNRDQFKDMLDPGNFEITLCPLSSSSNQLVNTGSSISVDQNSGKLYSLIDESYDIRQKETDGGNLKDWYYITSGSLTRGIYGEPTDNAWGIVFPKIGLIVLDGVVLDQSCSFNTVTSSIDGQNQHKLFLSISGSSSPTITRNYSGSFFARSVDRTITETYFCQIGLEEFNYSNNPTYVSGSNNYLKYDYFKDQPITYITSIGLYNRSGDLVAIGKLKKPVYKDVDTSYVFEVKIRLN